MQTHDFLDAPGAPEATGDPEPVRRLPLPIGGPRPSGGTAGDYIPAGGPPPRRPVSATLSPHNLQPPVYVRWGPPATIPKEVVELNRKAVDLILLGEIEEALTLFQKAMEIAPDYEDASINYRELLSRLVERRVAQWQTEQAGIMLSEAGRQAARYAKRTKRFSFGRLLRPGQGTA